MSFGVILLFYAIFINFLISKKKKRNIAEFGHYSNMEEVGIDSINFKQPSNVHKSQTENVDSVFGEKDFDSIIKHIQNANRFVSRRSKVQKEHSENDKLVDLRWFNNN
jgi:hypothetical protein